MGMPSWVKNAMVPSMPPPANGGPTSLPMPCRKKMMPSTTRRMNNPVPALALRNMAIDPSLSGE
jgi:hypothetical protein